MEKKEYQIAVKREIAKINGISEQKLIRQISVEERGQVKS
jgi:hypothetical protein